MKIPLFASCLLLVLGNLLVISGSHAQASDHQTVNVGGRDAQLNADGTWSYISTDRYADTKDGNRVRLKEDGSWEYVGNALLKSKKQVRTTHLDIQLNKVVIETFKQKANKSSRIKTQTVFHLDVSLSSLAKNNVGLTKEDIAKIKIEDDTGRVYPVLSIQPSPAVLKPDSHTSIIVRADKSPSFLDDAKSMTIHFYPDVLGLKESISFSQKIIDFDELKVDGFETP